ncbi:hypothetical protein CEQ31_006575 [Serratia odorifera]|jgi:hypothetical protein|uniref:Uncharacterized protein n=1 Tax=Serratia odorifera DSM 4582 TaxID=667129 RepID=D4E6J9_SEROD|nr:hypothetical protein HMPREF0758_3799 [Serratia odorifera DSM 4582]PNK89388.1 hypothetical protein CEQ31_006575 [Serratia odorifera]RII70367.1 hypothetical protein DX901_19730 [Serratia odorifera]
MIERKSNFRTSPFIPYSGAVPANRIFVQYAARFHLRDQEWVIGGIAAVVSRKFARQCSASLQSNGAWLHHDETLASGRMAAMRETAAGWLKGKSVTAIDGY